MKQLGGGILVVGLAAAATLAQDAAPLVVFVFDQSLDTILRIEDNNRDGDTTDAGEVTRFFDDSRPVTGIDNSPAMLALGPHTLLAVDTFPPDNIVLLDDTNRDGDAFDSNEALVFFAGNLPGGLRITFPLDLIEAPDGSFLLLDNNSLDVMQQEAIYRLRDLNNDGDVDDEGEVELVFLLSPAGISQTSVFDLAVEGDGTLYFFDGLAMQRGIARLLPGTAVPATYLGEVAIFSLLSLQFNTEFVLAFHPQTGRLLATAVDAQQRGVIVAMEDLNQNNIIDAVDEVQIIWSIADNADGVTGGVPRDMSIAADGSIVIVENMEDQVLILRDLNLDGDLQDEGETTIFYDASDAANAGQAAAFNIFSVAVEIAPFAFTLDFDGDGVVTSQDLLIFFDLFTKGEIDVTGDGTTDSSDYFTFLQAFFVSVSG